VKPLERLVLSCLVIYRKPLFHEPPVAFAIAKAELNFDSAGRNVPSVF